MLSIYEARSKVRVRRKLRTARPAVRASRRHRYSPRQSSSAAHRTGDAAGRRRPTETEALPPGTASGITGRWQQYRSSSNNGLFIAGGR